jgi:hypothetical protein
LKADIEVIRKKYKASGQQDHEDPQANYWCFCGGNTLALYSFVVFGGMNMAVVNLMGKSLEETGMDTGISGAGKAEKTETRVKKNGLAKTVDLTADEAPKKLKVEHAITRAPVEIAMSNAKIAIDLNFMVLNTAACEEALKDTAKVNFNELMARVNATALKGLADL